MEEKVITVNEQDMNPVDQEFNYCLNDPWQGSRPEFDYIPIVSKEEDTEAFYWLWPC